MTHKIDWQGERYRNIDYLVRISDGQLEVRDVGIISKRGLQTYLTPEEKSIEHLCKSYKHDSQKEAYCEACDIQENKGKILRGLAAQIKMF